MRNKSKKKVAAHAATFLFNIIRYNLLLLLALDALDADALQKVETILRAVVVEIYNALDTRLDNQL